MNEQLKSEIKDLSEVIFKQINNLTSYEQGAPRIDVDIAKENIRKLYENLDLLINENWKISKIHQEEIAKIKSIEETIDDQVEELLNTAAAQFENDIDEINQQIAEQEEIIEEQSIVEEEDLLILDDNIENPKPEPTNQKAEEKIVTKEEEPLMHSEEKAKESTTKKTASPANNAPIMGNQLNKKPISNLKSAIGINDKFQFINELFNGSMQTFNQAINEFDQAENLEAAIRIYDRIAEEQKWEEENQASLQLLDYIQRRFL